MILDLHRHFGKKGNAKETAPKEAIAKIQEERVALPITVRIPFLISPTFPTTPQSLLPRMIPVEPKGQG